MDVSDELCLVRDKFTKLLLFVADLDEINAVRVAHDVGGDDRIFGVLKNTLELALGGSLVVGTLSARDGRRVALPLEY